MSLFFLFQADLALRLKPKSLLLFSFSPSIVDSLLCLHYFWHHLLRKPREHLCLVLASKLGNFFGCRKVKKEVVNEIEDDEYDEGQTHI